MTLYRRRLRLSGQRHAGVAKAGWSHGGAALSEWNSVVGWSVGLQEPGFCVHGESTMRTSKVTEGSNPVLLI